MEMVNRWVAAGGGGRGWQGGREGGVAIKGQLGDPREERTALCLTVVVETNNWTRDNVKLIRIRLTKWIKITCACVLACKHMQTSRSTTGAIWGRPGDSINVSILVVILNYSFVRYYHPSQKEYKGPLCIISYNFVVLLLSRSVMSDSLRPHGW